MSLQIIALLIMTAAAVLVGYHVFSPANKDYFNRMGQIPLHEDALPTASGEELADQEADAHE